MKPQVYISGIAKYIDHYTGTTVATEAIAEYPWAELPDICVSDPMFYRALIMLIARDGHDSMMSILPIEASKSVRTVANLLVQVACCGGALPKRSHWKTCEEHRAAIQQVLLLFISYLRKIMNANVVDVQIPDVFTCESRRKKHTLLEEVQSVVISFSEKALKKLFADTAGMSDFIFSIFFL